MSSTPSRADQPIEIELLVRAFRNRSLARVRDLIYKVCGIYLPDNKFLFSE